MAATEGNNEQAMGISAQITDEVIQKFDALVIVDEVHNDYEMEALELFNK